MGFQGATRDVNIHNADTGTGIRSEALSISVALATEQKTILEQIATNTTPPPGGVVVSDIEKIGGATFTLGQHASAQSLSVVFASDNPPASSNQLPASLTVSGNLKTALLEPIPAGTNVIGSVGIDSIPGVVSSGNSTTNPLLANVSFTGSWEEVKDYSYFTLAVFADQNSASGGLKFQWSNDGVSVHRQESTNVFASTGRAFSITVRARYFRVSYVNGTSDQGSFSLQVVYHKTGSGLITKPLSQSVTDDNFALLVQSPVMGRHTDGTFANIVATAANSLNYNLSEVGGTSVLSGLGASGSGAQRVAIVSDQTPIPASQSGTWNTRLQDGSGTALTSQANGSQRALDVGINVAGVQIDPRVIRALTAADVVTAQQGSAPWSQNVTQVGGSAISLGQQLAAGSLPVVLTASQLSTLTPLSTVTVTQSTASSLNAQVAGDVAAGSADSGNPVKVGAKYNSTLPAITSGNRTDLQANAFGELATASRNKYAHISGAATTTVKSGAGRVHIITVNAVSGSTAATVYDNTAGSGTVIAAINTPPVGANFGWDIEFSTGLTIVTAAAATDLTVCYQ